MRSRALPSHRTASRPGPQLTSQKSVYRSTDGGKTWSSQMELLRSLAAQQPRIAASTADLGITRILHNSKHCFLLVGNENTHFYTHDAGRTYTVVWHDVKLGKRNGHVHECSCTVTPLCAVLAGDFKLHPESKDLILASTMTKKCSLPEADGLCFKSLLLSTNAGETWRKLEDYVVQYGKSE